MESYIFQCWPFLFNVYRTHLHYWLWLSSFLSITVYFSIIWIVHVYSTVNGYKLFKYFIIINNAVMDIPGMAPGVHRHVSGYTPNSRISGCDTHLPNSVDTVLQVVQFIVPSAFNEFPLFHTPSSILGIIIFSSEYTVVIYSTGFILHSLIFNELSIFSCVYLLGFLSFFVKGLLNYLHIFTTEFSTFLSDLGVFSRVVHISPLGFMCVANIISSTVMLFSNFIFKITKFIIFFLLVKLL